MSLYDQPDYSLVEHPSCEDPIEPEAPECPCCHEDGIVPCYSLCAGCLRVTRDAVTSAEYAAQIADAAGRTLQAQYIRLQIDGLRADGTARA